jgi:hypothetical protein
MPGDDDEVRARRVGVVGGALDDHVVARHRGGLGKVERLALRQALHDVHQPDVGQSLLKDALGGRGTDIAGADDGYERIGHEPSRLLELRRCCGPAILPVRRR